MFTIFIRIFKMCEKWTRNSILIKISEIVRNSDLLSSKRLQTLLLALVEFDEFAVTFAKVLEI